MCIIFHEQVHAQISIQKPVQVQTQERVTFSYDASGNRICRAVKTSNGINNQIEIEEKNVYDELLRDFFLKFYPNPAKDFLTLEISQLPQGTTAKVTLLNNSGNIVLMNFVSSGIHRLNISSLPAGVYILSISAGNSSTASKILKQ